MDRKISFFDLDHTLLKVNGSFQFGIYLYKKGLIPKLKMLTLLGYYTFHKWGLLSPEKLNEAACKTFFSGKNFQDIENLVNNFLQDHLDELYCFPVIKNLVDAHHQGHYTVILSSSPHFLVQAIAKRLGVDEWGATKYAINKSGDITHIESHMVGETKALHVNKLCQQLNIPTSSTIAYSDSYIDLPFLKAVGTAIGVNPDKKLRKFCQSNKWAIMDFSPR
jgi:HAD superfamily hydrolase (TIGR01490 family)